MKIQISICLIIAMVVSGCVQTVKSTFKGDYYLSGGKYSKGIKEFENEIQKNTG